LWYHDKAKVKGLMSSLSRMQRQAALWIIGAFRTSPMGGCEAIAGLIPIHLHIRRLADRSSFRANTLAASHPLITLLGSGRSIVAEPHARSIYHMTAVMQTKVKSSLMEVNSKMLDIGEVFEPLCPELAPGKRFMDRFSEWVTFFEKPRGMKPEDWMDTLDEAVDRACQLTDHVSVFSDASSTKKDHLQAASAAFIEHRGSDLIQIKCPASRATAPDAELFAICLGLLRCLRLEDVKTILVFTGSVASAHAAVDPSTHSGQSHSLAVIRALIPWLEADPLHKVQFWYIPSQARWDSHGKVHKYVTSTTGKVAVTPATHATLNSLTSAGRSPLHKTWTVGTTCSTTQNIAVLISYTCGEKKARCLDHPPIRGASGSRLSVQTCSFVLMCQGLFLITLLLESTVSGSM
jgi:hypothetical protein